MRKILLLLSVVCLMAGAFGVSAAFAAQTRVVHVVVALCDNVHQRIVRVPAKLGDGGDPANNLYWGAAYGVKTFMRKQPGWSMQTLPVPPRSPILERLAFTNKTLGVVIVADAYKGKHIKAATVNFLRHTAGQKHETLSVDGRTVNAGGAAGLSVYIGHNGLMDFSLDAYPHSESNGKAGGKRQAAIFACRSKDYFEEAFRAAGCHPLIWTRGNMAPEAYTLHALVTAWASGKKAEAIREDVAAAYHKYQKCGMKGARNLFATGW
ncbi:MAG: hypothetical protein DELT_00313 [Desulfovibrio sp.]